MPWQPLLTTTILIGSRSRATVCSSWRLSWKPPSPAIMTTGRPGPAQRRADRRRQGEAHRPHAAGGQEPLVRAELERLRRPHLMLADVDHERRGRARAAGQLVHELIGVDPGDVAQLGRVGPVAAAPGDLARASRARGDRRPPGRGSAARVEERRGDRRRSRGSRSRGCSSRPARSRRGRSSGPGGTRRPASRSAGRRAGCPARASRSDRRDRQVRPAVAVASRSSRRARDARTGSTSTRHQRVDDRAPAPCGRTTGTVRDRPRRADAAAGQDQRSLGRRQAIEDLARRRRDRPGSARAGRAVRGDRAAISRAGRPSGCRSGPGPGGPRGPAAKARSRTAGTLLGPLDPIRRLGDRARPSRRCRSPGSRAGGSARSPFCSSRLTWPVRKTAGDESKWQPPIPVSRLVAPGPLVARATPGTPVIRP